MERVRGFGFLFLGLCWLGCSGAGDETQRGDGPTGAASNTNKTGEDMKAAGAAGMAFGNTNAKPPVSMAPPDAPDAGCVDGTRCFDEAVPDTTDCGHQNLNSSVMEVPTPGNVLLVFDTSGSMAMDWNGMQRWQAVGSAIQNALTPLADLLTVGTIFFPRSDPNGQCLDPTGIACIFVPGLTGTCGVTPIAAVDQINFAPGPQFLTTFAGSGNAPPYAPITGGLTPLKEGLQQAQAALASTTLTGITAVIVITDGDPNCEWDEAVSTQIVTDWNAQGIKTYVLGVPGLGDMGVAVLNNLAAAGGTGMYISPEDASALELKVGEIVTSTVTKGIDSCTIELNPAAEVPDKLHLVATEMGVEHDVPRDLSAMSSWKISKDGATVTLEGGLCDAALAGRYESLTFQFGCVELPPLVPPPDPPPPD